MVYTHESESVIVNSQMLTMSMMVAVMIILIVIIITSVCFRSHAFGVSIPWRSIMVTLAIVVTMAIMVTMVTVMFTRAMVFIAMPKVILVIRFVVITMAHGGIVCIKS